eukprot:10097446-Alexandrium_andersonii.AAC.1
MALGSVVGGSSASGTSASSSATSISAAGYSPSTSPADIPLGLWSRRRRGPPSGLEGAAARVAAPA